MRDVRNRKLTTNTFVSEEMVTLDISCNPSSSYDVGSSGEGFQYETPTIHILVFMVQPVPGKYLISFCFTHSTEQER